MKDKLQLKLDPNGPTALYEQLAVQMRNWIVEGVIPVGGSFPSVANLSKIAQVSTATVRRALEQLSEEGWLNLKRGARACVADSAIKQAKWVQVENHKPGVPVPGASGKELPSPVQLSRWAEQMSRHFEPGDKQLYDEPASEFDFLPGTPGLDLLSGKPWQEAISAGVQNCLINPRSHYEPSGMVELRRHIARLLFRQRGIECEADDVFIVSGSRQARHLIARILLKPGVKVAVEDPGSLNARLLWQAYGAEIIAVPSDESGLLVEELEKYKDIALLPVSPSAQFPTGAVLSQSRRKKIAAWAKERQVMIVEDDAFSEFAFENRLMPALASFVERDKIIYLGSFSQVLVPSWRIGYMVVPESLREPLSRMKWLVDRCTSPIVQQLTLELLNSDFLDKHTRKSQQAYEQRRAALLNALQDWPKELVNFTPVKGGLYQTVWLPDGISDEQVAAACKDKGVEVLALSAFYFQPPGKSGLLLNFAALPEKQIVAGLQQIKAVLEKLYGA